MTVRPIIQAKQSGGSEENERILTSQTSDIETFDGDLESTVTDLLETMAAQPLCVGLAATQLGLGINVAVASVDDGEELVMVNPRVLSASGKKDIKRESCMSLFGWTGPVERREKVTVEFEDLNGETQTRSFKGFSARVVQHEVDHLSGVLYRDHVDGALQETDLFDGHSPDPGV